MKRPQLRSIILGAIIWIVIIAALLILLRLSDTGL